MNGIGHGSEATPPASSVWYACRLCDFWTIGESDRDIHTEQTGHRFNVRADAMPVIDDSEPQDEKDEPE